MVDSIATASFDFLFKTIVVGDGAVGKTAITFRYAVGKFQENYKMTIGVDFTIKREKIKDKEVKVQVWDTGGQEKFSKIRPLYYRGALGCLLVYDVTSRESFENLEGWLDEIQKNCTEIPIILVGNKIDLKNRKVTKEDGKKFAAKMSKRLGYKIPYLETSAKTGETIKKVFTDLITTMVHDAEESMKRKEEAKKAKKKK
ncbi:MAG: GTP-binding protein [Candidatus Heimdallarchaeota archaeon]|nr:GTP-binding protein [Candidatus Heimdallarchaeota archaeon]MBY8994734.1 GTP-binding protein [Candidatus Heimdallarchaeota archaeon]